MDIAFPFSRAAGAGWHPFFPATGGRGVDVKTWTMNGRWLAAWLALPLTGCALGGVRQVKVDALGPYDDARGVEVEVKGEVPDALKQPLQTSFQGAVEGRAQRPVDARGAPLRVEVRVLEAVTPESSPTSDTERVAERARTAFGLTAFEKSSGRLALEGVLLAPGEDKPLGLVRWESAGTPETLAARGGREAGEALGQRMARRRDEFVNRRAADERLFLTPTALTLEPGELVLSNDELLLFRLGVGLGRRVQVDMWGGALPIPAAGGVPLFLIHAAGGAGAAGIGVLGTFDLGLKVKVLEESRYVPGLAVSYDFLNVFAGAIGGGGVVIAGNGVLVEGAAGAAGANLQFNLFSLVAAKHFGDFQLTAGAYLLDNHHLIPQGAAVVVGAGGNVEDGNGGIADGQRLPRLPTYVQGFVGAQYVLGPHSELAAEFLPRAPFEQSILTTGVRWLVGGSEPRGPLAADRLRVRLDLAALWVYLPQTPEGNGGHPFPLPWVGVGLYKL
ncbi:hypothetical protein MEBOL_003728 [Melittangium boletus DSM 14713]|uniref:Uncharacterized protein n=1 Tax=Melittangium boletus DSM 14713 TaxID=1294270 RepID=A0A250IG90_9BACT|nr:hypothetical protein MEBOL_003728 [Melittangium boletus DSM 14713]